jgi:Fe-S cluster biogenesis protein NfuA
MGRCSLDGVAHARSDEGIRPITQTIEERVNAALDKVRPGIAADGGEVWLIKVEEGVAYVQMLGACGGCPASMMTLKGAIETIVRADVPEIKEVVEV